MGASQGNTNKLDSNIKKEEELSKGTTTKKCAEKFGVSIQTVFRYKAKLRKMNM